MSETTDQLERPDVAAGDDVLGGLAGLRPGGPTDVLRALRPAVRDNAQQAYDHLFRPLDDGEVAVVERLAVATFVARLHGHAAAVTHYGRALAAAGAPAELVAALDRAVDASVEGPYGTYREAGIAAESVVGPEPDLPGAVRAALGVRLAAALDHANLLVLHPRDSRPERLEALVGAGWSTTGIVTLSQLVAFLSFQLRAATGLSALAASLGEGPDDGGAALLRAAAPVPADHLGAAAGGPAAGGGSWPAEVVPLRPRSCGEPRAFDGRERPRPNGTIPPLPRTGTVPADVVRRYPNLRRPERFTREPLGWVPWLEPLAQEELTERHLAGLTDPRRASFPYFRLLARDPEVLGARTRLDNDVFYNEDGGLPRYERELAAATASRINGCVFCASVHARFAAELSGRGEHVDRLLADGPRARVDERWDAVVDAAERLTLTPPRFGAEQIERLRAAGLEGGEIVDVVNGAAFFGWANRLMLSIGEPEVVGKRVR